MEKNIWIHWNMDSKDIANETIKLINKSINVNKCFLKDKLENKDDFYNSLCRLSNDMNEFSNFHSMCNFLQYVSPDKKIRKFCHLADIKLTNYTEKLNSNENLFRKIVDLFNFGNKNDILDDDDRKFFDLVINGYKKNGVNLKDNEKILLLKIKEEISKIEKTLIMNFEKDNEVVNLTSDEILGLPKNIINLFPIISQNPIKYGIIMTKSNYIMCMKYIENDTVRKNLEFIYNTKLINYLDDILRLFILRHKQALILGYNNYSELKIEGQITNSSEDVKKFLNDLLKRINSHFEKELETIKKFKKNDLDIPTYEQVNINSWDIYYYITKWKKQYGLNEKNIREYFPIRHVLTSTMKIYQKLFNVKFIYIKDNITWNKDVFLYAVHNMNNNYVIGYFYLDLYKRNGKSNQMRCFSLQSTSYDMVGKHYRLPISALVASFDKPTKNNFVLLSHNEVVNFFHEFAHIMHQMFGKTKYNLTSGSNTQEDFIEIPAQVLENLCWDKQILKILSCHYKYKIPLNDETINKLIKIRNLNIGITYKKYIFLSVYDQLVHSSDQFLKSAEEILNIENENVRYKNITDVITNFYQKLYHRIMNSNMEISINSNEGIFMPFSWINIICGNALYYSNILSKINSADIYLEKFHKKNLVYAVSEFKEKILSKGGLVSKQIIKNYLERDVNINNFFKLHNLTIENNLSFFLNTDQIDKNSNSPNILTIGNINFNNTKPNNIDFKTENEFTENFDEITEYEYVSESESGDINKFSEIYNDSVNNFEYVKNRLEQGYSKCNNNMNVFIKNN